MPEYLIFFNDEWVTETNDAGWQQRSRDVRAVIAEMKTAGVYIFAGGLDNDAQVFHVEPGGGTPTGEALQKVVDSLPDYGSMLDSTEAAPIIILATDGEPNGCANAATWMAPSNSSRPRRRSSRWSLRTR